MVTGLRTRFAARTAQKCYKPIRSLSRVGFDFSVVYISWIYELWSARVRFHVYDLSIYPLVQKQPYISLYLSPFCMYILKNNSAQVSYWWESIQCSMLQYAITARAGHTLSCYSIWRKTTLLLIKNVARTLSKNCNVPFAQSNDNTKLAY